MRTQKLLTALLIVAIYFGQLFQNFGQEKFKPRYLQNDDKEIKTISKYLSPSLA